MLTRYFRPADLFGWTPSQVKAESALIVGALLDIVDVRNEVREDKARSERRRAANEGNRRR